MDHSNGDGVPSSELHEQIHESSDTNSAAPPAAAPPAPGLAPARPAPVVIAPVVPEPQANAQVPPHKIKHAHKFIVGYLAILVLVVGAGLYSLHNAKVAPGSSAGIVPANSTVNVGNVAITYVNMPDLTSSNAGNISGPAFAAGHYLYVITNPGPKCNGSSNCPSPDSGTLVYDGHHIYTGSLDTNEFAISSNGLHFEYSTSDTGTTAVFTTDITKITTQNSPVAAGTLSDDGLGYAYIADTNPSGTTTNWSIYKNNSRLGTITDTAADSSADSFTFSGDLSHYIGSLEDQNDADQTGTNPAFGDTQPKIILDGKTIATLIASQAQDAHSSISGNGQHYIYSWDGSVVVDGKTISPVNPKVSIVNDAVTDAGVYTYTACAADQNSGLLYLGTKSFPVGACSPNNLSPSIHANATGDNYFYWNGVAPGSAAAASDQGILDGKPYTLSGHVAGVQFVGNTLYVYRWVNN